MIAKLGQIAGDGRADQKTQSKCNSNDPERFRSIFRPRHIRNVSLGNAEIARGQPIDDPGEKHNPQAARRSQDQKANERPHLADQQNGPAPNPVGKLAERRSGH